MTPVRRLDDLRVLGFPICRMPDASDRLLGEGKLPDEHDPHEASDQDCGALPPRCRRDLWVRLPDLAEYPGPLPAHYRGGDGDEIRTGSSVLEVEYPIVPDGLNTGISSFRRVIGYAVTVDLGEKGAAFLIFFNAHRTSKQVIELNKRIFCALDEVPCLPFIAYAGPGSLSVTSTPSEQKAALDQLLRRSGPRDVPFVALPQLVRFLDISDKSTKRIVSPFDLSASFGPGVELSRVVLELTRGVITPAPPIWPQGQRLREKTTNLEDTNASWPK